MKKSVMQEQQCLFAICTSYVIPAFISYTATKATRIGQKENSYVLQTAMASFIVISTVLSHATHI